MAQNLAKWSQVFDVGGTWSVQANVVVTNNNVIAPDGTMTGAKIDTTGSAINFGVFQSVVSVFPRTVTRSVWVKGTVGETVTIADPNATIGVTTCTFDGTWQRIWLTEPVGATAGTCGIWIRHGTAAIFYVWGAQITETNGPAPYVRTTSAIVNGRVPRGQVPRQNLIANSESIAGWSLNGSSVVMAGDTHPLGAVVSRLVEDSTSTYHYALAGFGRPDGSALTIGLMSSETYTVAIDFKAGTTPYGQLSINGSAYITVNLSTGSAMFTGGAGYIASSITPISDGWYRVTVTGKVTGGPHLLFQTTDAAGTALHLGNGTDYIRCARASVTATNGPVPHAASSSVRLNEGTPRGQVPRQNLLQHSNALTTFPWTTNSQASLAVTGETAPTGGAVWRVTSTSAGAGLEHIAYQPITGLVGTVSTYSAYMRAGNRRYGFVRNSGSAYAFFDLQDGVVSHISGSVGAIIAGGIEPVGNGWFRCWMVCRDTAVTEYFVIGPSASNTNIFAVAGDYIDVASPQRALSVSLTPYVESGAVAINEGTPRGQVGRQNLILRSEDFSSASWVKAAGTVVTADQEIAPDGTMTADKIDFTAAVANTGIGQPNYAVVAKRGFTRTIWLKGTAGEAVILNDYVSYGGAALCVLNGSWQRFQYTQDSYQPAGVGAAGQVGFELRKSTANVFYAWGAQMTETNGAVSYVKTGGSLVNEGTPRGQAPRQNKQIYSENPFLGWTTERITNGGLVTAPDGTNTGVTIVDTAVLGEHRFYYLHSDLHNGKRITRSWYAKAGTLSWMACLTSQGTTWFNVSTGVLGTNDADHTSVIEPIGNGWYRCSVTYTFVGSGASEFFILYMSNANNVTSYTGDGAGTVRVWGMQATDTDGPVPYVKTVATAINEGAPRGLLD